MKKLAQQLIDLGYQQPELRDHLRPILAALEERQKVARHPMLDLSFDELFGEMRSAMAQNDVTALAVVHGAMQIKYRDQFVEVAKPYLLQAMMKKIQSVREGEVLNVAVIKSNGKTPLIKLKVESDYDTVTSQLNGNNSPILYVKKMRGRKLGSILHYKRDDMLYYQATLATQIEPILWVY